MKQHHSSTSRFTLIVIAISALLALSATPAAYAQANHTSVRHDGDSGGLSGYDAQTQTGFFLNVGRTITNNQERTFLFYQLEHFDPATNIFTRALGYGFISNGDFVGGGGLSLRRYSLNTNTIGNSEFFVTKMTCDFVAGTCTESSGGRGAVTADFQQTNSFSYRQQGSTEYEFVVPGYQSLRFRQVGTSVSSSAMGQVNLLGTIFNNAEGGIGANHGVSTTIERPVR